MGRSDCGFGYGLVCACWRFEGTANLTSEPVGKAEPRRVQTHSFCWWHGCPDLPEDAGHAADLTAGFLAEEIDTGCARWRLVTTDRGIRALPVDGPVPTVRWLTRGLVHVGVPRAVHR
jgi:hypothetical protein